jgi:anhydro-N-acetylmuramic acid kinase
MRSKPPGRSSDREERPGDLADLEREITLRHAEAVRDFIGNAGPEWRAPDVIGFHGQTVLHRPHLGVTVQLGDGALLAEETGIPSCTTCAPRT